MYCLWYLSLLSWEIEPTHVYCLWYLFYCLCKSWLKIGPLTTAFSNCQFEVNGDFRLFSKYLLPVMMLMQNTSFIKKSINIAHCTYWLSSNLPNVILKIMKVFAPCEVTLMTKKNRHWPEEPSQRLKVEPTEQTMTSVGQ